MKPKYWIDCPLCDVRMKVAGKSGIVYECKLCDTITLLCPNTKDTKAKYRSERLEERRIK